MARTTTRIKRGVTRGRTSTSYSQDLSTSSGLYSLAVNSGLQNQADSIVSKNKGETSQIFSGGMISDFFDVLNTLDYGVVGMLKGQSFMDGVKNRESFADDDALGTSLLGKAVGTVLDIAVDPLTYIAPATIFEKTGISALGKIGKEAVFGKKVLKTIQEAGEVAKGAERTVETVEGGTKAGKWVADKLVYMFGKDPIYKNLSERSRMVVARENSIVKGMTTKMKGIMNMNKDTAKKILNLGEDYRFDRAGIESLKNTFTEKEIADIQEFGTYIDKLGQEEVNLGLLSKETYESNKGKYLKSLYTKYEQPKKEGVFGYLSRKIKGNKARKDLSKETIESLGRIENPAYIYTRTALEMINDIENTKFFNQVAEKFGTDVAQDGFTIVKQGQKSLGNLAGKYIPDTMYKDITEMTRVASDWEKLSKQLTREFKFFKVVMNPASHFRNMMSNKLLNNFDESGIPLWRLDKDISGWKSVLTKDKWYKEFQDAGGALDTFTSQELNSLLEVPKGFNKVSSSWNKTKEFLSNLYQNEELGAKMTMYKWQRINKGLNPEEAYKIAERATFNYAQVTPFIRNLRSTLFGAPFITFTTKAIPVVAKTVLEHPTKISNIAKIRNTIESLSPKEETEAEKASEPSWVKNGFYVKLPFKDSEGRSAYFDLTYILPFGDLVNLGEESDPASLVKKVPALNLVAELGSNKDYYGNQIWKESDSTANKIKDITRHIMKTYLPPAVSDLLPGGYNESTGEQRGNVYTRASTASKENTNRTIVEELARQVGMKIQPINADMQETYLEYNTKKDLEKLLQENGITKTFTRTYIPQ